MIVRTARPEDCAALAALDAQCNPSPWSAAQFQTALNNRHSCVIIMETAAQTPAGFAVWQTLFDESELHLIATAPAQRRQGVAAQLLAEWFQTALSTGVRRCFLEVRASNLAAQALYRKHGFSECGRRRDYYPLPEGGREDAVWMEKIC
ncbi:ribosomal protein S18-alanine N-acetyltransferase [Uruburuella testudinis]|uniref:[Ribosomal protein bS18]-alanine N-acetyltransferase n=1 Tax=Uruburuella testudinis TaxID=1282863 RepID=A0ABY4DRK9_9NEIS|nr:ribosomal protein S18-alanine N-acetyltransferase [Uruburuella testudinis]UOO81665.1 ribosomal protein S18-alanine N-acetyltransferase [Uruburuella testudinis]